MDVTINFTPPHHLGSATGNNASEYSVTPHEDGLFRYAVNEQRCSRYKGR